MIAERDGIPAAVAALVACCLTLTACTATYTVDDPIATLSRTDVHPGHQAAAFEMLDADPEDPAYLEVLSKMMWKPGYTVKAREEALRRLEVFDPDGLQLTLRRQLPRMGARAWHRRCCELIADREWVDLTPALVSSWATDRWMFDGEEDRPEHIALARLYGEDQVIEVVFATFVESRRVADQGLRMRCWVLLHRLGYRDRMIEMIRSAEVADDDVMLLDLRAAADELGIVPTLREEILWIRKLRQPEYADFWSEAIQATAALPPEVRLELELRDLPVIVASWRHRPERLEQTRAELYEQVAARLKGRRTYSHGSNFDGHNSSRNRLMDWRRELRVGDLLAILIALDALDVPQVRSHLFDYAGRDRADESTEYGGVIDLDERGRYQILEFPPRVRQNDNKFNASQAMFDAAYTALFHFHFHVQVIRNEKFAGPGFGDIRYADGTRSNCLVLTSVNKDTMNVDYYRHAGVSVDLGVISP